MIQGFDSNFPLAKEIAGVTAVYVENHMVLVCLGRVIAGCPICL